MTFQQELASWLPPTAQTVSSSPEIGSKAPSSKQLGLPNAEGKATIVAFLRHCGCPFAEKTFRALCKQAEDDSAISFVVFSHSSEASTSKWLSDIPVEKPDNVRVIVDSEKETYMQWGLGSSSVWHFLNPMALYSVYTLGKSEGIWNRPTESGSRWQTSGAWAVDKDGIVKWGGAAKGADEIPDFLEAVRSLNVESTASA